MAEGKKGFILYADLIHTVGHLPDEQAGRLLKHILQYVNDKNPVTDDVVINIAFEPIKQQLKRDLDKWEEIREKRRLAGKASAEARKSKNEQVLTSVESVEQSSTNPTVNDNVNVNVNVNDNVILYTFGDFWDLYDKKRGDKTKVEKRWYKLTEEEQKSVMDYIPNYKEAQPDKQYRKDPMTFLNNRGWEDELIFRESGKKLTGDELFG